MRSRVAQPRYLHLGSLARRRSVDKARNCLTDSEPKVRFSGLPVLHSATGERKKGGKEILYNCPVYTCPARAAWYQLGNYISLDLRSEGSRRASGRCAPCVC